MHRSSDAGDDQDSSWIVLKELTERRCTAITQIDNLFKKMMRGQIDFSVYESSIGVVVPVLSSISAEVVKIRENPSAAPTVRNWCKLVQILEKQRWESMLHLQQLLVSHAASRQCHNSDCPVLLVVDSETSTLLRRREVATGHDLFSDEPSQEETHNTSCATELDRLRDRRSDCGEVQSAVRAYHQTSVRVRSELSELQEELLEMVQQGQVK